MIATDEERRTRQLLRRLPKPQEHAECCNTYYANTVGHARWTTCKQCGHRLHYTTNSQKENPMSVAAAARRSKPARPRSPDPQKRKAALHPAATGTTTPGGIAVNDPDAAELEGIEQKETKSAKKNGKNGHAHASLPSLPSVSDPLPGERWQDAPSSQVLVLDVDQLKRHPDNRVPTKEDVAGRAESLAKVGQLEPIVVWECSDPLHAIIGQKLTIISGETRWLAAKKLGWPTIQGRIATGLTRAEALALLAQYNHERKDLDPIQRAKLGLRLTQPEQHGGGGLTLDQAAPKVGLADGASLSNLIRILQLPEKWQARVAAGELSQRQARQLVPYAKIEPVLKGLENDWIAHKRDPDDDFDTFRNSSTLDDALTQLVHEKLRILDEPRQYSGRGVPAAAAGEYPCLIDDDLRSELELVELDLFDGKKPRKAVAAINVERYDELQCEAIKLHWEQKERRAAKRAGAKVDREDQHANCGPANSHLSKAEEQARDEQRVEQLAARIAAWRHRWLCELSADCMGHFQPATWRWVLWMMRERTYHVADAFDKALPEVNEYVGDFDDPLYAALSEIGGPNSGQVECQPLVGKLIDVCRGYLLLPDSNPKFPRVPREIVDELATQLHVHLPTAWTNLWIHKPRGAFEAKLEAFLQLHTADQLDELGDELSFRVRHMAGKGEKIRLFLNAGRPLKLPASIALLPELAKGGKVSKQKAAKKTKGAK